MDRPTLIRAAIAVITLALVAVAVMQLGVRSPDVAAPTTPPSATAAATTTPSATATARVRAIVSIQPVEIPAERRYLVTGFQRLLVLNLATRTAAELGRVNFEAAPSGQALVALSESADGRLVLLTAQAAESDGVVFPVRPEHGEFQETFRGHLGDRAVLAPDGRTFAVARASSDPAVSGVWLVVVENGLMRRLSETPRAGRARLPYRSGSLQTGASSLFASHAVLVIIRSP